LGPIPNPQSPIPNFLSNIHIKMVTTYNSIIKQIK
jgi:hypothetical protein